MNSKCSNKEKNLGDCTCTYSCEKRGICCECIAYHRRRKEIPGCFFSKEGEKTWDRSVANFIKDNQ
ncbi:MAG: hypothetical protein HZA77_12100 [Candidatus Schekmanbacteria bacterium]|nr:hypothetical protein [Candidatus Schekmanbacteria bacterium]